MFNDIEEYFDDLNDLVNWSSIEKDAILGYENELTRLAEIKERKKN